MLKHLSLTKKKPGITKNVETCFIENCLFYVKPGTGGMQQQQFIQHSTTKQAKAKD